MGSKLYGYFTNTTMRLASASSFHFPLVSAANAPHSPVRLPRSSAYQKPQSSSYSKR